MTNKERIQTAEPEELAAFLHNMQVRTVACALTGSPIDQEPDLVEWLQEEEDEEEQE